LSPAAGSAGARRVVRAPNQLAELVLALPALRAAGAADVLVVQPLAPLLACAGLAGRLLELERGTKGFWRGVRAVRHRSYQEAVLLAPSFSSALLFAMAGVPERTGAATHGRAALLTRPVPPTALEGRHRSGQYLRLVDAESTAAASAPALEVAPELAARWAPHVPAGDGPVVGLFPGGSDPSRRWDAERYAQLASRLAGAGCRVVVFGSTAERPLTAAVAGRRALDMGGRTDLPLLAAGLAACTVIVAHECGPLVLAAAVGTRTVSLWGAGDPAVTGPLGPGHRLLRHDELPCVPCGQRHCPRDGAGFVGAEAERECMRLIQVSDVEASLRPLLALAGP
jgi:ADP-heptose:LPS heptosyltransferase